MVQNLLHHLPKLKPKHYKISMDTYVEFSAKEGTRRQCGGEPGPTPLISDLHQIMTQSDKWLSLLSNGENKIDLIHLFVNFLKKYELKHNYVPIIINDGEHTWRIEDGISPLKLFSTNHEKADSRIAYYMFQNPVEVL